MTPTKMTKAKIPAAYSKSAPTKPVSTRLTSSELASISGKARTAGLPLAEWIRKTILADPTLESVEVVAPSTDVLLQEILLLQTLVLNLYPGTENPNAPVYGVLARMQARRKQQNQAILAGQ